MGKERSCNGFNAPGGVLLFEELCFLTEIPAGSCNNSIEAMPILSLQLYLYKPTGSSGTKYGRGITGRYGILFAVRSRTYIIPFFLFFPLFSFPELSTSNLGRGNFESLLSSSRATGDIETRRVATRRKASAIEHPKNSEEFYPSLTYNDSGSI